MALWQWSTTPANNASAGLIDWAEGQPPSTVNDSARQMMADVATWFTNPEWFNYGLTPTFVNGTTFTVAGNQIGIYTPGRRVRALVSAGIIRGTISTSAFTSLTTVTVKWDSGALDSGVSEVDVWILNPSSGLAAMTIKAVPNANDTLTIDGSNDILGACIKLIGNGSTTPSKTLHVQNGSFSVANDAFSANVFTVDDSGNVTASGASTATNFFASSDDRLKKDWEPLPPDFIEQVARLKRGTFTRIATGRREAGSSAQDWERLLPEVVFKGDNGMLSLSYANAALITCMELAEEVVRLRALLEPAK